VIRILFIELLGGLGDVLIALPALQALAASQAPAHTTVLTFTPGDQLLTHHPLVQRVWPVAPGQARAAVAQALQTEFDLIVTDTTYDGIAELVRQSGAARTVTNLWRQPPPNTGVSDRMVQILQAEGLISAAAAAVHGHPRIHLREAEQTAVQARLQAIPRPRIGLYADAGMAIKRWAPERFVALGQLLQRRYNAQIVLPQGASPAQTQAIADQLDQAVIWPRGPLRELAALFTQLDAVVAADTGPARIAAAVGTPTVTLFGPSWRGRYGQPAPHQNLQGYPDCPERHIANFTEQACWYSGTCPFAWDTCVNLLSPEAVADAVGEVVRRGRVGEWGVGKNQAFTLNPQPSLIPPPTRQPTNSPPPFSPCRNLLILRLDNIGDVLMTAPALRAIKATQPETCLTLLASPAGAQAAAVLPWVDRVIPWRTLWQAVGPSSQCPEDTWEFIETLRAEQFDGAIVLTSFRQSPHPAAWICQMAGIPRRWGASKESGECLTHRVADLPDDLHQVDRNLRLVEVAGYQVGDRHLAFPIPPSPQIPPQPYLLINPWASCPSRMYDLDRFAIAARTLANKTGYPVVVTGMAQHREAAAPLLAALGPQAIDRIGQTTLADLVALVAHAQLMISTNTATLHIADATETPSVILFAGTELERQWQPRRTRARLLRRPTPCSPCYAFTCPHAMECLDIPPEDVVAAALALLPQPA
jgi:ADP-heptose:LPS heptosyltransferase